MSSSAFFNPSVLNGCFRLAEILSLHPEFSPTAAVAYLEIGPVEWSTCSYGEALLLGEALGWELFRPTDSRQADLRRALASVASTYRPFWAQMSPLGRNRVRSVIDEDADQCLEQAGLFDLPPDEDCVSWWDSLARHFRDLDDQAKLEMGRSAEMLSLAYERDRLAASNLLESHKPIWVGFEDSTLGYDILTWVIGADGTVEDMTVEVKGFGQRQRFFISRNEWETAKARADDRHLFHLWLVPSTQLQIVTVNELEAHIPRDSGYGTWSEAEIQAFWLGDPS